MGNCISTRVMDCGERFNYRGAQSCYFLAVTTAWWGAVFILQAIIEAVGDDSFEGAESELHSSIYLCLTVLSTLLILANCAARREMCVAVRNVWVEASRVCPNDGSKSNPELDKQKREFIVELVMAYKLLRRVSRAAQTRDVCFLSPPDTGESEYQKSREAVAAKCIAIYRATTVPRWHGHRAAVDGLDRLADACLLPVAPRSIHFFLYMVSVIVVLTARRKPGDSEAAVVWAGAVFALTVAPYTVVVCHRWHDSVWQAGRPEMLRMIGLNLELPCSESTKLLEDTDLRNEPKEYIICSTSRSNSMALGFKVV